MTILAGGGDGTLGSWEMLLFILVGGSMLLRATVWPLPRMLGFLEAAGR